MRSILAPGTRVALEHGGAAPVIVSKSADKKSLIPKWLKEGLPLWPSLRVGPTNFCVSKQRGRQLQNRLAISKKIGCEMRLIKKQNAVPSFEIVR